MKLPLFVFANLITSTLGRGLRATEETLTVPCRFLKADVQYESDEAARRGPPEFLDCALDDGRIVRIGGPGAQRLQQRERQGELVSGESSIYVDGATIDSTGTVLSLPSGKEVTIGKKPKPSRRLQQVSKYLAVRIIAADASTTASEAHLSDSIFGTNGDPFNLKVGYETCSHGEYVVQPAAPTDGPGVSAGGTTTVTISNTVAGGDDSVIWQAANAALNTQLGFSSSNAFDHVLFCVPPGTAGGWIAYAYINYHVSVYNDNWCTYPSGLMHEIGHNLGLGHSGEGTATYGDQSGMMGYSYSSDDGPVMCFNGAKSYQLNKQLGWYSNAVQDVDINNGAVISQSLVGTADYPLRGSSMVVLRLTAGATDYYVAYNRQTGINSGTREAGNQVMITTRTTTPTAYGSSLLVAKLNPGGEFTLTTDSGKNYAIKFESVTTGTPQKANVVVSTGCTAALDCDDGNACTADSCAAGVCVNTPMENCCLSNSDCSFCGGETCNTATNVCEATLSDPCDDGNACTIDTCSSSGTCSHQEIAGCCASNDDCDFCSGETCSNGTCQSTFAAPTCDDGNVCTNDSCSTSLGQCLHDAISGCCEVAADCGTAPSCKTFTCDGSNQCVLVDDATCCGNGKCEIGESCSSCPQDCGSGEVSLCGNGVCDIGNGENCSNCPEDCAGNTGGNPKNRYCCGSDTFCGDNRCGSGCSATFSKPVTWCCGDGTCTGPETATMCPMDNCSSDPAPTPSPPPPPTCGASGAGCKDGTDCCSNTCLNNKGTKTCF